MFLLWRWFQQVSCRCAAVSDASVLQQVGFFCAWKIFVDHAKFANLSPSSSILQLSVLTCRVFILLKDDPAGTKLCCCIFLSLSFSLSSPSCLVNYFFIITPSSLLPSPFMTFFIVFLDTNVKLASLFSSFVHSFLLSSLLLCLFDWSWSRKYLRFEVSHIK